MIAAANDTAARIREHVECARDASRMIVIIKRNQGGRHGTITSGATDLQFWIAQRRYEMERARSLKMVAKPGTYTIHFTNQYGDKGFVYLDAGSEEHARAIFGDRVRDCRIDRVVTT